MTGLWALTAHQATYRNENLLQANLLVLPLAFLVPRLAAGSRWAVRPALVLASVVAALSLLGAVLQVLPGLDQVNAEPIAMLLPANAGLCIAVLLLARRAVVGDQSVRTSPSAAAITSRPGASSAA